MLKTTPSTNISTTSPLLTHTFPDHHPNHFSGPIKPTRFTYTPTSSLPLSYFLSRMALPSRPIICKLNASKPAVVQRIEPVPSLPVQKVRVSDFVPPVTSSDNGKIVLQPRLCTLRSYGDDPVRVIKSTAADGRDHGGVGVSPFFATLSEYIESSKKSHDFEIVSGRLAMIVFVGTVMTEVVTGNSIFRKMDVQGIAEAAGLCMGAITCAAIFAWFSSARNRVGTIFSVKCYTFIDSLIDQIIDGMFYDTDLSDWSDEL